jgi:hypothetical protein
MAARRCSRPAIAELSETMAADVVGTFTVSSVPAFGRQPPEKVPSSR